ncbi:nucleoside 2-deoxyribosyltransferase [Xenophilus arseniciresistens]|uniref:Nucleoside 2-deoxyribosyltransferase n=1 Tax=Xenophilus arseniciresistens TaxID=1283306 RepID=A0AAE3N7M7_9BURK|nr:nucleoside 2-deoxyribosyltransferase [Xenophilus arseniciresistens]MDA7415856.1 nucleoside 2-deoxyribosyltransferase [Xenophilus arseniciresistens]
MPQSHAHPLVYLAGPDVFLPDSARAFEALKAACARHGLQGLEPSDGELPEDFDGTDDERAQRIYEGNIRRIARCDAVLAHVCDFRGLEPDSGTVFEIGYAVALGKPVATYGVTAGSYADRVAAVRPCTPDAQGVLRETASGLMVEGLGQRLNLMLTRSTHLAATFDEALAQLARLLGHGREEQRAP